MVSISIAVRVERVNELIADLKSFLERACLDYIDE